MPTRTKQPPSSAKQKCKARQIDIFPTSDLTLLVSATLSGQSTHANLQWSANGQALITSADALYVLTPCLGFHPKLTSSRKLVNVESHPDYFNKFDIFSCQVDYKTFIETDSTQRVRHVVEKDYSDIHPATVEPRWIQASWSPAGMGSHGSSLILAVGSEFDVYILGSRKNPFKGGWSMIDSLGTEDLRQLIAHELESQMPEDATTSRFPPDAALLRKQSRATECLCAAWSEALPSSALPGSGVTALIAAGTRSGHLAIWEFSSATNESEYRASLNIGEWDISQVSVGPWTVNENGSFTACIAVQDSQCLTICRAELSEGTLNVTRSATQPQPCGLKMISVMRWIGDYLVCAMTGEVWAFSASSGTQARFLLEDGGRQDCDPFLPSISIQPCGPTVFKVILQDSSEYSISLDGLSSDSAPASAVPEESVLPLATPSICGYVPLLKTAQKQFDSMQRLQGSSIDSLAWNPAAGVGDGLVGIVRTNDPVASFGFEVSHTFKFSLLLNSSTSLPESQEEKAMSLLTTSLDTIDGTTDNTSLIRIRHVLAHFYVSPDKKAFAKGLASILKQTIEEAQQESLAQELPSKTLQRCRAAAYVAEWLQREEVGVPGLISTSNDTKALLLASHLSSSLDLLLAKLGSEYPNGVDVDTYVRFSAAAFLFTRHDASGETLMAKAISVLEKLGKVVGEVTKEWEQSSAKDGTIETNERCPACQQGLLLKLEAAKGQIEWAQCRTGHVWPRCNVTLRPLVSTEARGCIGCWAKLICPPGSAAQADDDAMYVDNDDAHQRDLSATLLSSSDKCWACWNTWVVL